MFLLKVFIVISVVALKELICADGAWAWGPAVHTVISCNLIGSCSQILPAIASIVQAFPHEYIYGGISADFFIGKGQKKKKGHSHNWETGFKLLSVVNNEREAAYAYGFLSHLAADVVAHNYFVPDLIHRYSRWKRMGHFYSEAVADRFVDPIYLKIAKDVLAMDHVDCDRLLKSTAVRNGRGLRAKKHIYTQSVRISDYLYCLPVFSGMELGSSYNVEDEYMAFMIELSFKLVKDLLSFPDSSACLAHDPIGSDNLRLASSNGFFSKLFNNRETTYHFPIAQEFLEL